QNIFYIAAQYARLYGCTKPDHFITSGLDTFSTWDETYVHHLHNDDRTVLMVREEDGHREPWTWTREYGDGRVFYTAYGHDERTWEHPGFQELVKRGILWAVGERVRGLWDTYRQDMPELAYQEDVGPIPNYEQRDPSPQFQEPLSPEDSRKLMQVPPGFRLELFASEPDVINPITMDWDERGRLWVVETVDYPNTVREVRTVGDDRIKICEDTDGDGRADKFTIFADNLNIPTSMAFVNGGVLVAQAPYFIFLKDTDGDDRADVREIVMDGWGTFDTHAGPSNLQYGLDNKIWGVVGYSGFEGTIGEEDFRFRQGIYRFSRAFDDFEFLTPTSNNTWGLGFTSENEVFASTANNTHSVYMSIPDAYFEEVRGIPLMGSSKIDGHYAMHPITPNFRQVDVFGGFTAAAGHHFYTAADYPEAYHDRIALVCEPTGGLVHAAIIEPQGAGFEERDGWNLLAGADEWVSPVEAKVGPDGQVWVADWYNFIVQHNPTPTPERGGFEGENGAGNAYINPLRDKAHGRIWRVVYDEGEGKNPIQGLDPDNADGLVAALASDNRFWRMTAQRLLVERGQTDVIPQLLIWMGSRSAMAALHALWTLEGLDAIKRPNVRTEVIQALEHPAPAVRKAAIQIASQHGLIRLDDLMARLGEEDSPRVQLAILLAITDQPASRETGDALYTYSQQNGVEDDPYLAKALYVAASKHREGFVAAYLEDHPTFEAELAAALPLEDPAYDDSRWQTMDLPQRLEQAGLEIDGEVWFRATLELTAAEARQDMELHLGPIDETDETWVNGQKVGGMERERDVERVYRVPTSFLQAGTNQIAIRTQDERGWGGFRGEPEQFYYLIGGERKSLPATWKYKVTEVLRSYGSELFFGESLADVLVRTYWQEFESEEEEKAEKATAASATVDQTIELGVIKNEMKYDRTEFT
ncbi:MAG: ThuA domain-containing protein, partial [Desulfobacterales bacterium]